MKQLLNELDADTAARLQKDAPARSRRRSEFIRAAIRHGEPQGGGGEPVR
jgi:predicted transcriptional regulator